MKPAMKFWVAMASVLWLVCGPTAMAMETVKVAFTQGMSLRSLARDYLGYPDEWPTILKYNGLSHPSDLKPNMELIIPTEAFRRTMDLLNRAIEIARKANLEGAGVLAEKDIKTSLLHQKLSFEFKQKGRLDEAQAEAGKAIQWGESALSKALDRKIRPVTAVLNFEEGMVQNRKPSQSLWTRAHLHQQLIEKERIRTLDQSRAEVMFSDESAIHMDENSLAVIGQMRENVIKKAFKAEVTVLRGDVLVHLSSLGGHKEFTVNCPGIDTKVRSKKFRASRDTDRVTRIANYDGEIDVAANQGQVTIKKNEGTKIEAGKKPEKPRKLLPPPMVIHPLTHQTVYSDTIHFQWEPVKHAAGYKLEIAKDRNFSSLVANIHTVDVDYIWHVPRKGVYFFRITSMDKDEFWGPVSETFDFFAGLDTHSPFLAVREPMDGQRIMKDYVIVEGNVELNAQVRVNGTLIETDDTGTFHHRVDLEPGQHTLLITATDPAGNQTEIERQVTRFTRDQLIWLDVPEHLVVRQHQVALRGHVKPGVKVTVNGTPTTLAQEFIHVVELDDGDHQLMFKATSDAGDVWEFPVRITVDTVAPDVILDPYPKWTSQESVWLAGKLTESGELKINDSVISVDAFQFSHLIHLSEGKNQFTITVQDAAGNTTQRNVWINRDSKAPVILHHRVIPSRCKGGEILTCQVSAKDEGRGLARTGIFEVGISSNPQRVKGMLLWNSKTNQLVGNVFIPPDVEGIVRISQLRIRDLLGNETMFTP